MYVLWYSLYVQFLNVFYAVCMFYDTAFMYKHAILCIFSPILEVEINIIIIIIIIIVIIIIIIIIVIIIIWADNRNICCGIFFWPGHNLAHTPTNVGACAKMSTNTIPIRIFHNKATFFFHFSWQNLDNEPIHFFVKRVTGCRTCMLLAYEFANR